jgi:hypothetical protein
MSKAQGSPKLRWALCALCVCAAGCSLFEGPVRTIRSAGSNPRDTLWRIVDELGQRVRARGDSGLEVLALSGGGQNGVYASGFLRGWRDRTSGPLPEFDLVTAVGSGTLQAPFALIGTKEALDRGAKLYRDSAITLAPTPEAWFGLRASRCSTGTGSYLRLVKDTLDERLQSELGPVFAARRQLAIATTDLDLGTLRIWDFGHELGTNEKSLKRAQSLMLATTSLPGAMEPVMIDDHVHATGNLLGNLLVPFDLEHYRALAGRLRNLGVTQTLEIRLWVVLNSITQPPHYEAADPDDRSELGERANQLTYIAGQAEMVERLTNLAYAINASVKGLHMQLRITTIPAELAEQAGPSDDYDRKWIEQLEQVGYDRALSESGWDRVVKPGSSSPKE